jgi:hypothetical protein
MALLENENERLKTQRSEVDIAAKPLECWDKETFIDNGNYVQLKGRGSDEKDLPFFTDRNIRSCRRARTNYGDETKFLPVLHKLARGECITVVALGGSITIGRYAGGKENSYDAKLIKSLNMHHQPWNLVDRF